MGSWQYFKDKYSFDNDATVMFSNISDVQLNNWNKYGHVDVVSANTFNMPRHDVSFVYEIK